MSGLSFTLRKLIYRCGCVAMFSLSAAVAISCSDNPWLDSGFIARTYEATIAGETKTALAPDGKVSWLAGDCINYYSQDAGAVSQYAITEDTNKAVMELNVHTGASYLTAVYGADAVSNHSQGALTLTNIVAAEQPGSFAGGHAAVARTTIIEEPTLHFYNLTSFITFSTKRIDASYAVFSSIDGTALHSNGTVIVGFEDDIPVASFSANTGNSIKINMNGAGQYFIATLPGALQNGFTISIYKSDGTLIGTATGKNALTIKRSSLANIGSIDSHLVDENGIKLEDYEDDNNWDNSNESNGDIDLGQYGDDYNWDSDTGSNGNIDQGGYGDDSNWNSEGNGNGDVNQGGYGDDSDWDSNSGSGGDIGMGGYGDDSNWN